MQGKENYSILLVDDDPTVVRILRSILAEFTPLRFATSGEDALLLARQAIPDLVLLDVEMPGLNGFDVCKAFKADKALGKVPIIFISSHENAELEAAGIALGAVDFISKPPHAALVLARVRAQLETKRLCDTMRSAVTLDFLTGTSNRLHFDKALQHEWLRARRSGAPVCVLLFEIDDFGADSQQCAEQAAENALRDVAETLRAVIGRPADLLARYAAGTFAALLPDTDSRGAATIARRAIQAVDALHLRSLTDTGHISISIGAGCGAAFHDASAGDASKARALAPRLPATKEILIGAAEQAVATACLAGGHRFVSVEIDSPCSSSAARAAGA